MVATVVLLAKGLMLKGVTPSGVAALVTGIELVKFVRGKWRNAEKGVEEDLQVFVISREGRINGKWGERDMDDSQHEYWSIPSRPEAMDDGGVKFVRVGEVEVKAAATPEPFRTQGTLVEAACRME